LDVQVEGLGQRKSFALRFGGIAVEQGQALNAGAQAMAVNDMAKDANVDGERLLSELGFDLGWVSSTSAYCPLSF
jgi:hypothetical protein